MKPIKVADDIHKTLKIRSAETGVEMAEIADGILRKGLKLSAPTEKPDKKNGK